VDHVAGRDGRDRAPGAVGDEQPSLGVDVPGDTGHGAAGGQLDADRSPQRPGQRPVGAEQPGPVRVRVGAERGIPAFQLGEYAEQHVRAGGRRALGAQRGGCEAGGGDRKLAWRGGDVEAGADHHGRPVG
jgi:hypothetical protein